MQGMPQKFDQAMVDKIEGTPLAPMGVAMQEEDVHRPIFRDIDHPPETNRGGLQLGSAQITSDNVRYGASEKCPKCQVMRIFPASTGSLQGVQDKT